MAKKIDANFSFNQQLWYYYSKNRGKIRPRYNDLTRKFLAYNDSEDNPYAFLRKPQFEALEMYVFVKEFMNNKQVYEMFDDWRNKRGVSQMRPTTLLTREDRFVSSMNQLKSRRIYFLSK